MDLTFVAVLILGLSVGMVAGRTAATYRPPLREWIDAEGHMVLATVGLAIALLLLMIPSPARSEWRDGFPRINQLERLNIGDAVEVHCREDETHPDFENIGTWPGRWEAFDAQVIAEESPGVFRLGAFPDMMAGKVSFEEFWQEVNGELIPAEELPGVQLKDFADNWPWIGPDVSAIYMSRTAEGVWSINSETRIRRYGWCGTREFDQMTGDRIDVTWDEEAQAFLGTSTVTDLPNFCLGRKWQPYRCEPENVRCQDYCAFLAEYDGRWEVKADRMRKWVELYGETLGDTLDFFVWQLAKLETYTDQNACTQAGDGGSAPPIKFAQCEIAQEMIAGNLSSPTRLSVWVPQYQRVGCPCAADDDGNGLPDYFDYAIPEQECPEVAVMPETTAHDAYLIPVPEPEADILLAAGVVGLYLIHRRRTRLLRPEIRRPPLRAER